MVVPLSDGRLKVELQGGERAELNKGASYFRAAGAEQHVVNASGSMFAFVEIELKVRSAS